MEQYCMKLMERFYNMHYSIMNHVNIMLRKQTRHKTRNIVLGAHLFIALE